MASIVCEPRITFTSFRAPSFSVFAHHLQCRAPSVGCPAPAVSPPGRPEPPIRPARSPISLSFLLILPLCAHWRPEGSSGCCAVCLAFLTWTAAGSSNARPVPPVARRTCLECVSFRTLPLIEVIPTSDLPPSTAHRRAVVSCGTRWHERMRSDAPNRRRTLTYRVVASESVRFARGQRLGSVCLHLLNTCTFSLSLYVPQVSAAPHRASSPTGCESLHVPPDFGRNPLQPKANLGVPHGDREVDHAAPPHSAVAAILNAEHCDRKADMQRHGHQRRTVASTDQLSRAPVKPVPDPGEFSFTVHLCVNTRNCVLSCSWKL
jgi:hypothetical protein